MTAQIALPRSIIEPNRRTAARWERGLLRREVLVLESLAATRIGVIDGVFWLTLDSEAGDHVLVAGQSLRVAGGQRAIIQALRAGRLAVSESGR